MSTALIAPEIVLYNAFNEFQQARNLCDLLNKIAGGEVDIERSLEGPPENAERPQVGLSHGYYAIMGGFVVDVSKLCDTKDRLTLNIDVVSCLMRGGRYLAMHETEIQDKSKANILAKGLACLQITWSI